MNYHTSVILGILPVDQISYANRYLTLKDLFDVKYDLIKREKYIPNTYLIHFINNRIDTLLSDERDRKIKKILSHE